MIRYPKPPLLQRLPAGHTVLEASAGTGKTYALEHLVVDLIVREGLPLDQILVVTFTEKAALELRSRVRFLLERLKLLELTPEGTDVECAWDLDENAKARLDQALDRFESATIATIHGFCQRVLQESAFECGRLFRQEVANGEAVLEEAFRELLRTRFTCDDEDAALLRSAFAAGKNIDWMWGILKRTASERGRLEPDVALAYQALQRLGEEDLDLESILSELKALKVHSSSLAAIRRHLGSLLDALRVWRTSADVDGFWDAFEGLKASLETQLKHLTRGELTPSAQRFGRSLRVLVHHAPGLEARLVQRFLGPTRQRAQEIKRSRGLFDFDDMIQGVLDALRGSFGNALRERLRGQYRVALIDEFQDTDADQWEIFRTLFFDAPHRLVLVGDPKQAIYGFRGGDLPTYFRARQDVLEGRQPVVLDENFRSTDAMIQAVNGLLEKDFFEGRNRYDHPVRCGRPQLRFEDSAGKLLLPLRVLDVTPVGSMDRIRREVALGLAQEIRAFMLDAPRLGGAVLDWGDVFVLTNSAREGLLMAEALRSVGVPFAFFKQEGLFQTPEAQQILDLLRAIERPMDPGRRARALLTPFFGLGMEALEGVAELAEDHPILQRLMGWTALARARRYPELFHRVLEDSAIVRRFLLFKSGEREITNVLHILELLQETADAHHQGFPELVRLLSRWVEAQELPEGDEGDLQRLEGDRRAVQILTMHKAKGLEAPVVALFGGFSTPQGSVLTHYTQEDERRTYVGKLPSEIKPFAEMEAAEEDQRLLYVALTRAKARLILPCFMADGDAANRNFDKDTGDPKGRYRALNRRLRTWMKQQNNFARWVDDSPPTRVGTASHSMEAQADWQPLPLPSIPESDYAFLRSWARPLGITSFTGLQHRLAGETSLDPEPSERSVLLPAGSLPKGPAMGILLHSLLEKLDPISTSGLDPEAWSARPEVASLISEELRQAHVPSSWGARVAELAYRAMATPLGLPGGTSVALRQVDPSRLLRELRFLKPYPDAPDFLTGSLDAILEHQGKAYVLDWKSNALADYAPDSLEACVVEHYSLQVRIYTLAALRFLGIGNRQDYEARFGGVLYVFLRGLPVGGVWSLRPDWDEVLDWYRALAALKPFDSVGAIHG